MDIKKVKERTEPFKIEWGGEVITGEYRPGELTGRLVREVSAAAGAVETTDVVATALERLIASWDVTCGGKAYPPTMEHLLDLPMPLTTAIVQGLIGGAGPNEKSSSE